MTNLAAAVELKACPFCGDAAVMRQDDTENKDARIWFIASCNPLRGEYVNQCPGSQLNTWSCTPEDAANAWNTRPPVAGLAELTDEKIVCLYDAMHRAEVLTMQRKENALGQMHGVDKAVIEAAREFLGKVDG